MSDPLKSQAVVDTGILIEYLSLDLTKSTDKQHKNYFDQEIYKNQKYSVLLVSFLTRSELLYIQCRKKGWELAKSTTDAILEHFTVIRSTELDEIAPLLKCQLGISLVDCFNLAIGALYQIPVYFLEEQELSPSVIKKIREDHQIDIRILKRT